MDQHGRVHLKLDSSAAASIDQYWEYHRIVGDDDGGKLFTPQEYEKYKKRVIPQRMKNRLFVSWTAPNGMDCKLIGPETPCFCNHRYMQHKTDFESLPSTRPIRIPCRVSGCKCKSYMYIPKNGSQPIRCQCKHLTSDHSEATSHKCLKGCGCQEFISSFTCGCGQPTYAHKMIIETKDERLARGHPVGEDVPYAAMGGVTGFSSLMDGYMRLDDSGVGPPPLEELQRPIASDDHPFLRAHAGMNNLRLEETRAGVGGGSTSRTKEEEDMAYFEKRYQERLQAQKTNARQRQALPAKGPGTGRAGQQSTRNSSSKTGSRGNKTALQSSAAQQKSPADKGGHHSRGSH